nr:glycosyltransferase [Candidatus Levybacteria bacterium]
MKLLSIVVPTLNEEKYLPLLLESFLNQTKKNFEIIVADGKSDDKTVENANKFKDRLDLEIIEVERKNVAHQRNAGGRVAKGDYVVFMDADYLVKKNFVEACFLEAEKEDADLIIPFSYPITSNILWQMYFKIQNYICIVSSLFGKPFGVASGNLIKKESFLKMGGYNESVFVFEDQYFFQVAKRHKLKIKYSNKIKMYFSLRRVAKDGVFGYFYFNIYATLYYVFKGPVVKKFYDYQMGGDEKVEKK